jgi:hypothetical protein
MPVPVPFIFVALLLPFAAAFTLLTPAADALLTIYVDCSAGSDTRGDGSASAPLASPSAARDYIRKLQPLAYDIVVSINGTCVPSNPDGTHNFSLPVLTLSAEDSAPEGRSVTYLPLCDLRSSSPHTLPRYSASTAMFMGGVPLDHWTPYQG